MVSIREYHTGDLPALLEITDGQWAEAIQRIGKSLITEYDGKITKAYVAYLDDELIGFAYGFALPNGTLLPEFLFVKEKHRGKGVAKELAHTLEKESGCSVSMIYYNKSLHNYYEKQGYQTGTELEVALKML